MGNGPPSSVTPSLVSRLEPRPHYYRPCAAGDNRTEHRGANRPRNRSNRELHGRWVDYVVNTVEDAKKLMNAAEYDQEAMLYLDYCNSMFQQPDYHRTAGSQYVVSHWNSFLERHRDRRDQLRRERDVPFRAAGTRSRKRTQASNKIISTSMSTATSSASTYPPVYTVTPSLDETILVPSSIATMTASTATLSLESSPSAAALAEPADNVSMDVVSLPSDTPLQTATPWDEAVSHLSTAGQQWALSAPEDWPVGIRALVDGQPTRVSQDLHSQQLVPFDDDVRGWVWLDSLAPTRSSTDASRYEQFMRVAIETMAVPSLYPALCERIHTIVEDRPIEHFPFETGQLSSSIIARWIRDHGVLAGSEDMHVIHGYAQQAIEQYHIPAVNRAPSERDALHSESTIDNDAHFRYPPSVPVAPVTPAVDDDPSIVSTASSSALATRSPVRSISPDDDEEALDYGEGSDDEAGQAIARVKGAV